MYERKDYNETHQEVASCRRSFSGVDFVLLSADRIVLDGIRHIINLLITLFNA